MSKSLVNSRKTALAIALIAVIAIVGLSWSYLGSQKMRDRVSGYDSLPSSSPISDKLSDEEKEWLSQHRRITVVSDLNWPPIEFAAEDGEPLGFSADYLHIIEQKLGISFTRIKNLGWKDAYPKLQRWEIDMATCVTPTPDRDKYWAFTKTYLSMPIVILTNLEVTYISDLKELEGKTVAVGHGYMPDEMLSRDYPNIKLVRVASVEEGIQKVQRREVFAFIDGMLIINYYLAKLKLANLKIAGDTPYVYNLAMGIRKDWIVLVGIIQKALDSITPKEHDALYSKWVPVQYEYGFDYRKFWLLSLAFALIIGFLLLWILKLATEIEQRKIAENALFESEQRFELAFRTSPYVITITRMLNGELVDVNQSFTRVTGYTREEALGKTTLSMNLWSNGEDRREVVETLMRGEQVVNREILFIRKNGVPLYGLFSANVVNIKGESLILSSIDDITEKRKAEEQIRFQAEVLNQISDRVTVTDLDGYITYVNEAECRAFNVQREALIGKHVSVYGEDPSQGATQNEIIKKTREEGEWSGEVVNFTSSGLREVMLCRTRLVFDSKGNPIAMCGIASNITEQKRAEQELRESESKFKQVFEAANVGKSLTLMTGEINVNQAFCDMLGYSPDELKNRTWQSLTPAEDIPEIEKILIPLLKGECKGIRFTKRYIRKDGTILWGDVSVSMRYDAENKPLHFITTIVDITVQVRAQQALKDSENYIRTIMDNLPIGIAVNSVDPTVSFTYINDNFAKIYRTSKDALLEGEDAFWRAVYQDFEFRETLRKRVLADCNSGDPERMRWEDIPITRRGEETTFITAQNILIPDSKLMISTVWDVTQRKRAEKDRDRLLTAIEQAAEIVVVTDSMGIIQYVNPAFERVTLFAKQEVIGKTPSIWKSGKQSTPFYAELWQTISAGKTWHGRLVNKRKDGSQYTCETTISPVCDETGSIVNYIAVKRDITESLRLEEQYLQSQKMESVGRLAGGVAHDFNNMLQVITGYAELALNRMNTGDKQYTYLEEILKAARHSTDITRQLLAFARRQTVALKVLNLNSTIEGTLKMLRRLIGEDIGLVWQPYSDLWSVKMDPSQIDQILANLCVNARDAITENGKITIETANVVIDDKYCETHIGSLPGQFVMVAVSDNGKGMDEATINSIFEPFFTTKQLGHGTGLGLSTVYGIVKQNQGFINVYSEPSFGSTFKIYLPRIDEKAETIEPEPVEIVHPSTETILVVEDESAILELSQEILVENGYTVFAANCPSAALEIANSHKGMIHLLITDVVMPGMNGRELAARIKQSHPSIRCMFMSGYTANVIAHHGVLDEGVHFIQKPFRMGELLTKVRTALESGK